jgi:hypothetical protein
MMQAILFTPHLTFCFFRSLKDDDYSTVSEAERDGKSLRHHGVGQTYGAKVGTGNADFSLSAAEFLCISLLFAGK